MSSETAANVVGGTQRLEPLHAKDHIKRSKGHAIARDVESLTGDIDGQVGATA
jgi:hypothetical protein